MINLLMGRAEIISHPYLITARNKKIPDQFLKSIQDIPFLSMNQREACLFAVEFMLLSRQVF